MLNAHHPFYSLHLCSYRTYGKVPMWKSKDISLQRCEPLGRVSDLIEETLVVVLLKGGGGLIVEPSL